MDSGTDMKDTKFRRIIYLSNSIFPSSAANSVHVMKMCQALTYLSEEVVLLARHFGGKPEAKLLFEQYGVKRTFALHFTRIPRIRAGSLFAIPGLWLYLYQQKPRGPLIYARDHIGAFLATKMGFDVIFESHGLPSSKYIRWLESQLFRSPNLRKLVVISKALKSLYEQGFAPLPNAIEVHHDGADIPDQSEQEASQARGSRPLRIGYIGHLYEGRGIDIILATARKLEDCEFHMFGGTANDVTRWEKAKPQNVTFHGHIDAAKTAAARAFCDILLMPYQKNLSVAGRNTNTSAWMSPMKLFEYMSSKRPIVSADLPVLREVLNESNAILVSPSDPSEYVSAITRLNDEDLRRRLSEKAYADFIDNYTWRRRAESIVRDI